MSNETRCRKGLAVRLQFAKTHKKQHQGSRALQSPSDVGDVGVRRQGGHVSAPAAGWDGADDQPLASPRVTPSAEAVD